MNTDDITTPAARPPVRIHAGNPGPYTGDGNNTWLIDGDVPALIDAGTGAAVHLDAVSAALDGRPLARVLITHGHSDHTAGVPEIVRRWPDVEVFRFGVERDGAVRPLADGQLVRAGDRDLAVVLTPGHAPDHVSFWDASRREAYTGDMVMRPGTVLIPAGRGGNLREYLASLERLAALDPVRLYPGHGPIIEEPARVIDEYVAHRRAREVQVLACMHSGLSTAEAIVEHLYPALRPELRNAALMTVQAHLDKIRGL